MSSDSEQNTAKASARGVRIVAISISSYEQIAVFLYSRFCLFLKDPFFFSDYLEVTTAVVVPRGVGKTAHCTSI